MSFFNKKEKKAGVVPGGTQLSLADPNKKDVPEDDLPEEVEKKPNRRFYYLIENIVKRPEALGVVLIGTVHGTVSIDDVVYITTLHGQVILSVVNGLEVKEDDVMKDITEATDQKVAIRLDSVTDLHEIEQYSVLSNIRPQKSPQATRPVENPVVACLLYEYERLGEDPDFFNWFLFSLAHAFFITPVRLSRRLQQDEEGNFHVEKDTEIAFRLLESKLETETNILPVFTDWDELAKWRIFISEEGNVETMIVRFPECVAITDKKDSDGFLINPFGDHPCLISKKMIQLITGSKGYIGEFGIPAYPSESYNEEIE